MLKDVNPVKKFEGSIEPPPDKSISHRAAMFAAISEEISVIRNYSKAADPQSTLKCLRSLGVHCVANEEDGEVKISGVGRSGFRIPDEPLDCGNSGTTMRLLGGILAGAAIPCILTGDSSLSSRTMKRIIDPLTMMGCKVTARDGEYAPLQIEKHNGVQNIHYPLPIASAQLKSAVLLAGLFGENVTTVLEEKQSRDHTERLLGLTSQKVETGRVIRSSRADKVPAQSYRIPGDFSAAAFWLVAGSLHDGSDIKLKNVGINPTRSAALKILEEMGADFSIQPESDGAKEPVAAITVRPAQLKGIELSPELIPNCIDELPILMVAMCFAEGRSVISGAEELRHKETDRLSAMGEILTRSGAHTELKKDGIVIHGDPGFKPRPAEYPTWHDHRMAMASAILASRSEGRSVIQDAECTAISYPEFWEHFDYLAG